MKTIDFDKPIFIPNGFNVITSELLDDKSCIGIVSEKEKAIMVSHHTLYHIAFVFCEGWDDISDTAKFCCNIARKRISKMIDRWS